MLKDIHKFRAYVVMIVLITAFGCLAANLFNVQVLKHDQYHDVALKMRTHKIRLYPNRGQILDRLTQQSARPTQVTAHLRESARAFPARPRPISTPAKTLAVCEHTPPRNPT